MKPVEEAYKLMLSEACAKGKKEGMDPIGREDGDIDNDGDKDSSDKYLRKRRDAIKQSMEEGAAAALQMATAKRRQSKSKEQNDAQDSSSDLSLQVDAFGKKPDHKVFPVDTFDQPKKMDADAKKIDGGVGAGKGRLPGDTASREPMKKVTQKEEVDVDESMKHPQYANLVGGLKKKKDKAADDKDKSIAKKQYGSMMGGLKKGWNEEAELDEAETTAEFLARGGKVKKLPPGPNPKRNPLNSFVGRGPQSKGLNSNTRAALNARSSKKEEAELDEAETTAEFLARGGKVKKLPPGPNPKRNPLTRKMGTGDGGKGAMFAVKTGADNITARSLGKNKVEHTEIDEAELHELKKSTLSSYIKKAADPLRKNSNVNLASRAANKLANSSGDTLAGEKEDNKAFVRSRGIQRAAQKLAKEEAGLEEKLETDGPKQQSMDKAFKKVPTTSASQAYSDMKAAQRRDMNKKNDPAAAKKGLGLSVVDRVKAAKKAKARGIKEGNGQEADQLSGLISKYNVNGTAKGGQEASDTKSIKKFDIKGFKAATQEPLEKVSEEYDEAKAAHDHGVKDATAGRPKKNASDIYAWHGGHYHAGYDSVKQKQNKNG